MEEWPSASHEARPPRIWTVWLAFVLYLVGLAALGVGAIVAYGLWSEPGVLTSTAGIDRFADRFAVWLRSLPGLLIVGLVSSLYLTGLALAAAALSPVPLRARLSLGRARLPAAGWAIVPLGALALSQAVDAAFQLTELGRGDALDQIAGALRDARGASLALAILILGAGAGLAEELFFRGYMQTRFVRRWGPWAGVLVTSLAFGFAHFDLHHSSFALLFGLYVGYVAVATGSIWPAVVAHTVNNMASVLFVALTDDAPSTRAQNLWALATGVLALAVVLFWLRRVRARPPASDRQPAPADPVA